MSEVFNVVSLWYNSMLNIDLDPKIELRTISLQFRTPSHLIIMLLSVSQVSVCLAFIADHYGTL